MRKRVMYMTVAAVLVGAFFSCDNYRMDDAEFAGSLLKSVVDNGYVDAAKAELPTVYDEGGLTIRFSPVAPSGIGVDFEAFQAYGAAVTGYLWGAISVVLDGTTAASVSLTLSGTLEVTGKHAGTYEFTDASITYDFLEGLYSFGGSVTVDGILYEL